ncbi:hypothetical protein PoB_003067200 [Plakobranchus ocellatus]|uniref:Uncharacterized protein n=1 Tax=Plakobranchus ocellatus TaxID=259542 RepID=A0AAV4ABA8_9GAST|nr:hypothetical protein PoB_003067200 [Plakobranchus ocellatus]
MTYTKSSVDVTTEASIATSRKALSCPIHITRRQGTPAHPNLHFLAPSSVSEEILLTSIALTRGTTTASTIIVIPPFQFHRRNINSKTVDSSLDTHTASSNKYKYRSNRHCYGIIQVVGRLKYFLCSQSLLQLAARIVHDCSVRGIK